MLIYQLQKRLPTRFELGETAALVRRQPAKFTKNAIRDSLLGISRIAPAARPCYLFFRIVDDIADGERRMPEEFSGSFEELVAAADQAMNSGFPVEYSDLLTLMMKAITIAERREIWKGEVRAAFSGFMAAMLAEYQRRVGRQILSATDLIRIHTASSHHAHQLGLIVLGSRNRAKATPVLAELIGRVDALRDLHRDLELGIVNVPIEGIDGKVQFDQLVQDPDVTLRRHDVQRWMKQESAAIEHRTAELSFAELDRMATLMLVTNAGKRGLWPPSWRRSMSAFASMKSTQRSSKSTSGSNRGSRP